MPCSADPNVMENCTAVPCPCEGGCTGHLRADGRNVLDSLTFLECDVCHCGYVAEDFPKATKKESE